MSAFALAAFFPAASGNAQKAIAGDFVHLVTALNQVQNIPFKPGMVMLEVLLQRPQTEFRLVVHLWRGKEQFSYSEYGLEHDKMAEQPLRSGDVIILGLMGEKRRYLVEQIPEIARILARSPASKRDTEKRSLKPSVPFGQGKPGTGKNWQLEIK